MKITGWLCALAVSAGLSSIFPSTSFGQITGKVTLTGKVPEMAEIAAIKSLPDCAKQHKDPVYDEKIVAGDKGELANVVIYIKTPEGKALGKPLTTPGVLDQLGCVYVPHVIAVTVGQPLTVKNSDMFLHNVHTLPFDNPAMNIGMPTIAEKAVGAVTRPWKRSRSSATCTRGWRRGSWCSTIPTSPSAAPTPRTWAPIRSIRKIFPMAITR